jgi:tetratricopeptide (TPR) repeat protein
MRPEPPIVPGLAETLEPLVRSLEDDASPRNVMKVAEALWITQQPARAVSLLEALVTGNPDLIAPHVLLAWCYEELDRTEDVREAFDVIRRLDPGNPHLPPRDEASPEVVPHDVDEDFEHEAEPERALTLEELSHVPPSPLYSVTLAEIFERQGFEEKAIEIYREILKIHPEREDLAQRIHRLESRTPGETPS